MPGLFITGNDTEIGKTQVAAGICHQLSKRGYPVQARKPVESGCTGPHGADSEALWQACGKKESLDLIGPYSFKAALAPPQAAHAEGRTISLQQLKQAARAGWQDEALVIIEAAGGYLSPISNDGLVADLLNALDIPSLLVVENRLGSINQCLSHLSAMQMREHLPIAIVLNQTDPQAMDNSHELESYLQAWKLPLFSIPHISSSPPWQHVIADDLIDFITAEFY